MPVDYTYDFTSIFVYDESSPTCIRWRFKRKGRGGKLVARRNNGIAGNARSGGYLAVNVDGCPLSVKNIVWIMHHGPIPEGRFVMNSNGVSLDVRIGNLQLAPEATYAEKYGPWLRDFFEYDESSPSCLRWKVQSAKGSTVKPGDAAGSQDDSDGYYRIHGLGTWLKAHKVVWSLFHDDSQEGLDIDHVDGDTSNNRIRNLRLVTEPVNARNKGRYRNNKTGVAGVSFTERIQPSGECFSKYYVTVQGLDGIKTSRSFSIQKYGDEEAFRLACEYRAAKIKELNQQGAGYSERHGT